MTAVLNDRNRPWGNFLGTRAQRQAPPGQRGVPEQTLVNFQSLQSLSR